MDDAADPYSASAAGPVPPASQPPGPGPHGDRPREGLAVAALVVSLLGGAVVGTVLGAFALGRIRRSGTRGAGMAWFAIWWGVLGTAAWVALGAGLIWLGHRADDVVHGKVDIPAAAAPSGSPAQPEKRELRDGDCLADFAVGEQTADPAVVSCTTPHQAQVFASVKLPAGGEYQEAAVQKQAEAACTARAPKHLPDRYLDKVDLFFLMPSKVQWTLGGREVTCLLKARQGQLTEHLPTR